MSDKNDQASIDEVNTPQDTQQLLNRVARIKGQVGGIERMLEEEAYCIDLINQIHSVERALQSLATEIMDDHLKGCVRDAIDSDDPYEEQEKIEEFMDTVQEFLKK
ncbi:MAG: metal-sensitive transcriptional regulator [bacterium]